jgi:hypothetical protein
VQLVVQLEQLQVQELGPRSGADPLAVLAHLRHRVEQYVAVHEQRPQRVQRMLARQGDVGEQVVRADDDETGNEQPLALQRRNEGQHDHRKADHPQHLQPDRFRNFADPEKTHQRDFKEDQKRAALEQEIARRTRRGARRIGVQPRAEAGEEHEDRRAEMRGQAREEQERRCIRNRHRVGDLMMQVQRLADVVHHHDAHDQSAQRIDGVNALGMRRRRSGQRGADTGKRLGAARHD